MRSRPATSAPPPMRAWGRRGRGGVGRRPEPNTGPGACRREFLERHVARTVTERRKVIAHATGILSPDECENFATGASQDCELSEQALTDGPLISVPQRVPLRHLLRRLAPVRGRIADLVRDLVPTHPHQHTKLIRPTRARQCRPARSSSPLAERPLSYRLDLGLRWVPFQSRIAPAGHASPATHGRRVGRPRGTRVDVVALDDAALRLSRRWMLPVGSAVCPRRGPWAHGGCLPGILVPVIPTGAHLRLRAIQRARRQADLVFGLPACLYDGPLACHYGGTLRLLEQLPHTLPGDLASECVNGRSELQSQIIRRVLEPGFQRLQPFCHQPAQHA